MQIEEPFYKVHINTSGLKFRVVANGVDIKTDISRRPIKVEIPINQYVRSGDNSFELQIFPLSKQGDLSSSDDAFAEIEYRLYSSVTNYIVLSKLKYSAEHAKKNDALRGSTDTGRFFLKNHKLENDADGDYRRSNLKHTVLKDQYNKTFITQTVTMNTPFPEWAFFSGDIIVDHKQFKTPEAMIDGLVGEPFKVLKRIHEALSKKDIDSIMPLFKERNDEMDQAYYYKPGTYERMLRDEFKKDLNDEDMILRDLKIDIAKPMISSGRQLMELGKSPLIRFAEKDDSLFNFYGIVFRKEGDKWIITR